MKIIINKYYILSFLFALYSLLPAISKLVGSAFLYALYIPIILLVYLTFKVYRMVLTKKDNPIANIVYTGGLGNINSYRRTPKFLFDAISNISSKLILNIYGEIPDDVIEYGNKIDTIKFHGLISHFKIATALNDADILIVILTPEEDLTAVPGKVYEYMYANKYIVALTDKESQLSSLLRTYNFASIVNPFDEIEICNVLKDIIEYKRYMNIETINTKMMKKFNRKENTNHLYNIIQNIGNKE